MDVLLTIAKNNGVPDETKTHLGETWHFLRVFLACRARMDDPNKCTNSEYDNFAIESPPMTRSKSEPDPEEGGRSSIKQNTSNFYQPILKHPLDKFLQRFEKRWMASKRLFGDKTRSSAKTRF